MRFLTDTELMGFCGGASVPDAVIIVTAKRNSNDPVLNYTQSTQSGSVNTPYGGGGGGGGGGGPATPLRL